MRGLLNVQFALAAGVLYVLEANPRASRTAPFVSKATGVPLAKAAARIMLGATIASLRGEGMLPEAGDGTDLPDDAPLAVKEAVLPFKRFRTPDGRVVDAILGPEMRSTGEVMGLDEDFPRAFAKSQTAAYGGLPTRGRVFVSVADGDKRAMVLPVKRLADLGFEVLATDGTAARAAPQRHRQHAGPQAQQRPGAGRRADDRPAHLRRRRRHRRQHAQRRDGAAPTATRSGRRRRRWTGRSSRRSSSWRPPSRPSRRRSGGRPGAGPVAAGARPVARVDRATGTCR